MDGVSGGALVLLVVMSGRGVSGEDGVEGLEKGGIYRRAVLYIPVSQGRCSLRIH